MEMIVNHEECRVFCVRLQPAAHEAGRRQRVPSDQKLQLPGQV